MIEIPRSPNRARNVERYTQVDDALPCVVCGKPINSRREPKMVRVFWGTTAVTEEEAVAIIATEGEGGDMYGFPIGSDCLRRHPELKPYAH